jgi:hypothetical protein
MQIANFNPLPLFDATFDHMILLSTNKDDSDVRYFILNITDEIYYFRNIALNAPLTFTSAF